MLGDQLLPWADMRCVGRLTWMDLPTDDRDYVVIQATGGKHYWIEVDGWGGPAAWKAGNKPDEEIARLEAWWAETLAGLEDPPASLSLGKVAFLGIVQWPARERGQPIYEERRRRLFGFIPWGTELVPRLV